MLLITDWLKDYYSQSHKALSTLATVAKNGDCRRIVAESRQCGQGLMQ